MLGLLLIGTLALASTQAFGQYGAYGGYGYGGGYYGAPQGYPVPSLQMTQLHPAVGHPAALPYHPAASLLHPGFYDPAAASYGSSPINSHLAVPTIGGAPFPNLSVPPFPHDAPNVHEKSIRRTEEAKQEQRLLNAIHQYREYKAHIMAQVSTQPKDIQAPYKRRMRKELLARSKQLIVKLAENAVPPSSPRALGKREWLKGASVLPPQHPRAHLLRRRRSNRHD